MHKTPAKACLSRHKGSKLQPDKTKIVYTQVNKKKFFYHVQKQNQRLVAQIIRVSIVRVRTTETNTNYLDRKFSGFWVHSTHFSKATLMFRRRGIDFEKVNWTWEVEVLDNPDRVLENFSLAWILTKKGWILNIYSKNLLVDQLRLNVISLFKN